MLNTFWFSSNNKRIVKGVSVKKEDSTMAFRKIDSQRRSLEAAAERVKKKKQRVNSPRKKSISVVLNHVKLVDNFTEYFKNIDNKIIVENMLDIVADLTAYARNQENEPVAGPSREVEVDEEKSDETSSTSSDASAVSDSQSRPRLMFNDLIAKLNNAEKSQEELDSEERGMIIELFREFVNERLAPLDGYTMDQRLNFLLAIEKLFNIRADYVEEKALNEYIKQTRR